MATSSEISTAGEYLASELTSAENNMPDAWKTQPIPNMPNIRRHISQAFIRGVFRFTNTPWLPVLPTGQTSLEQATFASGWLNREMGWAPAETRRVPALKMVQMRGIIHTTGSSLLIMTLPPALRPAKNELFATTVNGSAGFVYVWTDGTVYLDTWTERTTAMPPVKFLSLSGICYEVFQ